MATKTQELRVTSKVAEKNGTGGISLLNDHFRNHDTAFTPEERNRYSLEGLFHSRGIAARRAASRSKSAHPWVAALERVLCLVEGTKPNLKKINEYVGRSLMLVTALSPVIGYDKSSKIAHYALITT